METHDEKVNSLIDNMFTKRYSGNQLLDWNEISFFGGGVLHKYRYEIERLLKLGKKVKTGYRASTKIRGAKTYYIFYK